MKGDSASDGLGDRVEATTLSYAEVSAQRGTPTDG